MSRSIARRILLAFVLLAFAALGGLNATGFCWKERRYLSDVELFRAAIKSTDFGYGHLDATGLTYQSGRNVETLIRYNDVDEFMKENPDCCRFYNWRSTQISPRRSGMHDVPFFRKLCGIAWVAIAIRTPVRFIDVQGVAGVFTSDGPFWVDACGNWVEPPMDYNIG